MKHFGMILAVFTALSGLLCGCRATNAELAARAGKGDTESAAELGIRFFYGERTEIDYNEAKRYFSVAARHGDPEALYHLGVIAEKGLGSGLPDAAEALKTYEKVHLAFEAKKSKLSPMRDYIQAEMAFYGRGTEKNFSRALRLYTRAMQKLCYPAMIRLGTIYSEGAPGIAAHPERGRYYLETAAKAGYPEAMFLFCRQLSVIHPSLAENLLETVAKAGLPEAVAEFSAAQKKELPASRLAAQGYAPALLALAHSEKDAVLRNNALKAAAARGYAPALEELFTLYLNKREPGRARIVSECAERYGIPLGGILEKLPPQDFFDMEIPAEAVVAENFPVDRLAKLDSRFDFFAEGLRAGISGSRGNLDKYLEANPAPAYFGCDWMKVFRDGFPAAWAGDIFKYRLRSGAPADAAFLLNYGIAAGLAGQGALQHAAAEKLLETGRFPSYALLLQANALVMLERPDKAYALLQEKLRVAGSARDFSTAGVFANAWCPFLKKDLAKLAAVMQLDRKVFTEVSEPPVKQAFYDFLLDRDVELAPRVPEPEVIRTGE